MDTWGKNTEDSPAIEGEEVEKAEDSESQQQSKLDKSQYGNAPLGVETFVDYLRKDG